jgi:hypothetical protein
MANQYIKDGKIYSNLLIVDDNGKSINEIETIDLDNEFEVRCEMGRCNKLCKPGEAKSTGGNYGSGEINGWICRNCSNQSEAAYQASCFDVDRRESELAEAAY